MKIIIRNTLILLAPFFIMIVVNEAVRPTLHDTPYSQLGFTAMNSAVRYDHQCSWACHNDTKFCQAKHTTFMGPYFKATDIVYYGAITALGAGGAYGAANIIVFVILFPVITWLFIIGGLRLQSEIKKLKRQL